MSHVKGFDAVTVIRRALAKCPDEYPPSATTELLFIKDAALRENIRRDLGAANILVWKVRRYRIARRSLEAVMAHCTRSGAAKPGLKCTIPIASSARSAAQVSVETRRARDNRLQRLQ
jgi:hypothetical protein